ncbi:MAG: hypothetical protein JWO50_827 [Candidatus Kaiserbacteria bacterium]|nr:hypothetical protein [Candidatus Kaiserbacteria bacterium]
MVDIINNAEPQRPVVVASNDDSSGWMVLVIVLLIVIAGGAYAWVHYRRPAAPAAAPVIQVNVPNPTPAAGNPPAPAGQ